MFIHRRGTVTIRPSGLSDPVQCLQTSGLRLFREDRGQSRMLRRYFFLIPRSARTSFQIVLRIILKSHRKIETYMTYANPFELDLCYIEHRLNFWRSCAFAGLIIFFELVVCHLRSIILQTLIEVSTAALSR
jgi:hypothetical protein